MAKKKKKSRIKKLLKTLGKAAILGGTAYGASKLFGGSKGNVLRTAASEDANIPNRRLNALKAMTSNRAYTGGGYDDPIMTRGVGVKPARIDAYDTVGIPKQHQQMQWGLKKGGRVTGAAKRGFGRALMKGKK